MARPVKKGESLEIRIPYETKAAFMIRCRADGVSASEALRGFIEAQLADQPPVAESGRQWLRLAAGAMAALGLGATALPTLARPLERAGFDQLDADRNGSVERAEFTAHAAVSLRIDRGAPLNIGAPQLTLGTEPADDELRALILGRAFVRLDRDGDGTVSFAEFRRR
jgi:hypothetical protein